MCKYELYLFILFFFHYLFFLILSVFILRKAKQNFIVRVQWQINIHSFILNNNYDSLVLTAK